MAITIYSYFNVAQVATLMDGVAAITASDDYFGAIRLVALIGFLVFVAGVGLGKNRDPLEFFRWFLLVAIIHVILLVPKIDVVIVDRTTSQPPTVRENVPVGLAFFAGATSKIGDYLTRTFETVFAQPDDIQFQNAGVMFGNTVVLESLRTNAENPSFRQDLVEFINSCTYYDILEGRVSQEQVVTTADIWPLLRNTSQTRLTKLSTAPSGSAACDLAYTNISARFPGEISSTFKVRGRITNPSSETNDEASAKYQGQLTTAYSYLTSISQSATDIMRQSIMMGSMRESQLRSAQALDNASDAIIAQTTMQAEVTANSNFLTMARMAERAVPGLRNVVEILCYAVFPLVVLLMIASGESAAMFFVGYVRTLLWIQIMPCLYAVLNFVMSSVSRVSMSGVVSSSGVDGVNLQSITDLSQRGLSDLAIAGYLSLSIPLIAWALLKAGEVGGAALFGSVTSALGSASSSATGPTMSGNITQGNVSLDSTTLNTNTAHKNDTAPATRSGYSEVSTGLGTATFGAGSFVRFRANDSSIPIDSNLGQKFANSLSSEASRRAEVAERHAESASTAKSAALVARMGMVSAYSDSESRQGGSDSVNSTRSGQALATMNQVAEAVNKRLGLDASSNIGRMVVGEASLNGGIGGGGGGKSAISRILSAGASLGTKSLTNKTDQQTLQSALGFARDQLQNKNVSAETALSDEFRTSDAYQWAKATRDESVRGEEAALTKAENFTRSAEVARAQSVAMANHAQTLKENWVTLSVPLQNYVTDQLIRNGQLEAFSTLSQVDPERAAEMAGQYIQQWFPTLEPSGRPVTSLEEVKAASPELAGTNLQSPGFETSVHDRVGLTHTNNVSTVKQHSPQREALQDDVGKEVAQQRTAAAGRIENEGGRVREGFEDGRAKNLKSLQRENQVYGLRGPSTKEDVSPDSSVDRLDKTHSDLSNRGSPNEE